MSDHHHEPPMTGEEASLWDEARVLAWMLRDTRHWQDAYSSSDWYRSQEWHLVRLRLVYEELLDLRPDCEASGGLDIVHRALAALDEERHAETAQRILRAGRRPDVDRG